MSTTEVVSKYKDLNNCHCFTDGNEAIDLLLVSIGSLDLISKEFKQRIINLCFGVVCSHGTEESRPKFLDLIKDLGDLMRKTCVLSKEFQASVLSSLYAGWSYEFEKNKKVK